LNCAPVALFVYNRPEHTKRTISALKKNLLARNTKLIIFSDAPKNDSAKESVEKVRKLIKKVSGFKSVKVVIRKENFGLAKSIINGVTSIVNKHGKVIVVEDDLITSKYFLKYMNDALNFYENEEKVVSIHAYVYPTNNSLPETFFIRGADCWGWATWKRAWNLFEPDGKKLLTELKKRKLINRFDYGGYANFSKMLKNQIDGKNNSWAIRWHATAFLLDKLTLYSGKSLVFNIGNDASGTHTDATTDFDVNLIKKQVLIERIPLVENKEAYTEFKNFFKRNVKHPFARIRIVLRRLIQ
jgi:hypothetical protein